MGQTSNTTHLKQKIKLLPEHLIDQIKAGEVIERPASLIKELVENSVDAGSSRIDIHIIENGLELISVSDDGKGISFEDLPFAFCRHATSIAPRITYINNFDPSIEKSVSTTRVQLSSSDTNCDDRLSAALKSD